MRSRRNRERSGPAARPFAGIDESRDEASAVIVRPPGCATLFVCLIALVALKPAPARAQPPSPPPLEPLDHAVCRLIEVAAQANRLPVGFMTRVIWRESSFRAAVISSAGAEGIAQFMPETAQQRGLLDPFDPEQAIPKAARLLSDLRRQFGNLGLAAAAYNAGAARVAGWLAGQGGLPAETRAYVRFVTERDVEEWTRPDGNTPDTAATATASSPEPASCLAVAADLRRGVGGVGSPAAGGTPLAPWGVQLAGNFSKALALAQFERARQSYAAVIGNLRPMIIGRLLRSRGTRLFYQVRLPAPTRQAADTLCGRIQAVGGACVALRS
jgi:Transglycosylase SLT domain/SPOR domain